MVYKFIKNKSLHLSQIFTSSAFVYLTLIGNIALFAFTCATYHFEKDINPHFNTYWDALWWGLSTITTVGYGDIVPVTLGGKIMGMLLMLSGTVLFISVTGILVFFLLKTEEESHSENKSKSEILLSLDRIEQKLKALEKKIVEK